MSDEPGRAPDEQVGRRALGAVGWIAADKWGNRLSQLAVFAVLGRLVAPSDFGLITLATVYLAFVTVFIDSGFSQALVQRRGLTDEHANAAFWISMGIGAVLGVAAFALAPLAGDVSKQSDLVPVLRWLALTLPLTALSTVPSSLLTKEFGFRTLAIRRLSATAVGAVVAVVIAVGGGGVWALVAQQLTYEVVGILVLWTVNPWRPAFQFSLSAARELWSFGANVLGIELIQFVTTQADKLIVGLAFGPTTLGYYAIGSRLSIVMLDLLVSVIGTLSLPTFSRMQDDPERMSRALRRLTFVTGSIAFPAFAITAALAPEVLRLLFGDQWNRSVPIMQLLAPSAALAAVMWFDKGLFLGAGKPKTALWLALSQTVLGLVLVAGAVPFGILAVAASRSLMRILFWPIRLRALKKHLGLEVWPYLKQFLTPGIASLVAAGAITAFQASPWAIHDDVLAVLVLGSMSVLLFVGALVLLARGSVAVTLEMVLGDRRPPWVRKWFREPVVT